MSIESKKIVTDSELSENIAQQGTRRKPCSLQSKGDRLSLLLLKQLTILRFQDRSP